MNIVPQQIRVEIVIREVVITPELEITGVKTMLAEQLIQRTLI
jgi:hypothetical protein